MRQTAKKMLSTLLCAAMVIGVIATIPMTAFAAFDTSVSGDYFNVISDKSYALIPGATEREIVLNDDTGTDRKFVHVMEVDTKNPAVSIVPGYNLIDKFAQDPTNVQYQTDSKVTDMAKYYEDTLGYNVVGAMNTSLAYDSNAPYSFLMYEGVVLQDKNFSFVEKSDETAWLNQHSGYCKTYLAIKKDGTCELRAHTEKFEQDDYTVISANFDWCVKDGVNTVTSVERTSSDASRSMLGIKPDGTLVICQVDGRGANNSTGLSNYELGEMMLSLGCQWAVNCDGGGSSTFITQREGEEELTMRSEPSDGAERPTLHAIMVVSNLNPTGIFDKAVIDSDYDYFVPGITYEFGATGLDTGSFAMDIPDEMVWSLSDDSFGTIENGVFVSNGKLGTVDIQAEYNGAVVGSKTISIVNPDSIGLLSSATVIPYGKTVNVEIVTEYGDDNSPVFYQPESFNISVSDASACTVNGLSVTATTNENKSGVDITFDYKWDSSIADFTLSITYGKGSEVIWDFEDAVLSGFLGFDEAKQWSIDNGVNNSLVGSDPMEGQYSPETDSKTFITEKAHSGKYALAWSLDNTNAAFSGWTYNILFNVGETIVFRDTSAGKNATSLGMWLYIPEGATGLSFQSQFFNGSYCVQDHFMFETVSGVRKNLNSCTEADIPESRWVYASIDISSYPYLSTIPAHLVTSSRAPSFIRTYIKPTKANVHTFYIDDITLDYSAAVDDREAPVISAPSYSTSDTNISFSTVATTNAISFIATVEDVVAGNMSGLDYSSAKIYLDGVALPGVTASGSFIATSNAVNVSNGVHSVKFEIADKMGNVSVSTNTLTVSGNADVALGGHNDLNNTPEYDSIYYIDLNVQNAENIEKITTVIELNAANTWLAEYMTAQYGLNTEYSIDTAENKLTLTVTRTDDYDKNGAQTLVSIPVRVWYWDAINHVTGKPEPIYSKLPIVTIDYETELGYIEYTNGKTSTFYTSDSVATALVNGATSYHVHTIEAIPDQEAACTENGYTGRTYCNVCGSIVDFGTITMGTKHDIGIVDGKLACITCGDVSEHSGLYEYNGKVYYAIGGTLQTKWHQVDGQWYYFHYSDFYGFNGSYEAQRYFGIPSTDALTFVDGALTSGIWVTLDDGVRYYYGPAYYFNGWKNIDGNDYYFDKDGYRYTGYKTIRLNPNDPNSIYQTFYFDENGVSQGLVNGIVNGTYYKDGVGYQAGLVVIDGALYYVKAGGWVVTGSTRFVTDAEISDEARALGFTEGSYTFDAEGKMEIKNGVYADAYGNYYYYENGMRVAAGLIVIDNSLYYVKAGGWVVTNGTRFVTDAEISDEARALGFAEGSYTFDAEGKMEIKNGVYADAYGNYYYYENGMRVAAGLIVIDNSLYYVKAGGWVVTNGTRFVTDAEISDEARALGFAEGSYTFDAEGKMEIKNGVYADAYGNYYYYENGMRVAAGLIVIDNSLYYVKAGGWVVTNGTRFVTDAEISDEARALGFAEGSYTFDAEGKMEIKNGVYADAHGNYYYYENGKLVNAGLVVVGNELYYVKAGGWVVTNGARYISDDQISDSARALGYTAGTYTFDAEGKLV